MSYNEELFYCLSDRISQRYNSIQWLNSDFENGRFSIMSRLKSSDYDNKLIFQVEGKNDILIQNIHRKDYTSFKDKWYADVFEDKLRKMKPDICRIRRKEGKNYYEVRIDCELETSVEMKSDPVEMCDYIINKGGTGIMGELIQSVWEQGTGKIQGFGIEPTEQDIIFKHVENLGCSRESKDGSWKCALIYKKGQDIEVESISVDHFNLYDISIEDFIFREGDKDSFMINFDKEDIWCSPERFFDLTTLNCDQ